MRLARGSGVAGLAGMAARSRRGGVEIARPLLGLAKSELIALCEVRGIAFARDPSNEDSRFARPRLRKLAESLAAEGLDAPALARLARRAAAAEEALARAAAEAQARLGLALARRCDASALAAEPLEIVRRVLAGAIDADPLPLEAMERIAAELVAAIAARRRYAVNIAASLIAYDGLYAITIGPEPRRRLNAAAIPSPRSRGEG
jgi:tRNA(Ile)-lysidine synthase